VKLVSGLIFNQHAPLALTQEKLAIAFGEIDFESEVYAFNITTYYEQEFGKNLKRKFLTFSKLIPPEILPEIKLETNKIENELSHKSAGKRTVNIDPGYISLEKLVLATTKNFSHRPYLSSGIFAELEYYYKSGSFHALEWTYPEYRASEKIDLFNGLRKKYIENLSNMEKSSK
jgi:hypothetical protein